MTQMFLLQTVLVKADQKDTVVINFNPLTEPLIEPVTESPGPKAQPLTTLNIGLITGK